MFSVCCVPFLSVALPVPQWWTMSYLLRIPANSDFTGYVTLVYNEYGNVASFSAAQLSLIGYTDAWTWLQQALGSLGENICFDTLGIHARAQSTGKCRHLWAQVPIPLIHTMHFIMVLLHLRYPGASF